MIHEGMLLEASGRRLALLMYAAELKLVVVAGLFSAAFLPVGMATELTPAGRCWSRSVAAVVKLVGGGGRARASLDASLAKLRILALPWLLGDRRRSWRVVGARDPAVAAGMTIDPRPPPSSSTPAPPAIVVLGVGLAATRSIGRAIWLVAVQSVLAGVAAIGVGLATGAGHLVVGGLLAIVGQGRRRAPRARSRSCDARPSGASATRCSARAPRSWPRSPSCSSRSAAADGDARRRERRARAGAAGGDRRGAHRPAAWS